MGSLVNISMIHMKVGTFEHITMVSSTTMDARHRPNISNAIGDYNQTRIILYLPSSLQIDSFDFYSIIIVYPSKMKQTVILNLFLIFILCQLAFSQAVEVDSKRGNATKGKSQDSNKNPIPPSIRKCQNVHCEAGFFCLHGRCKKVDYGCTNLKCEKGFRCNKGQCVKQVHEPKQQVCKPLGYSRERLQCGPEQQNRCLNNSGITGVCGFIGNGKFQDFQSECSICLPNPLAKFFFRGPCKSAPRVCTATQECLNGVCTAIFNESVFENYRSCNKNPDCKVNQRCAGHKCVDKRDMFNYLQSKAETDQMGVTA